MNEATRRSSLFKSWIPSLLGAFLLGWLLRGNQGGTAGQQGNVQDSDPPRVSNPGASKPANDAEHARNQTTPKNLTSPDRHRHSWRSTSNAHNLFQSKDPVERLSGFVQALNDLGPHNIEAVRSAFETLPEGTTRSQEMRLLLHAWAKFAPKAAIEYAPSLGKSEATYAIRAALASWASYDAPAAMKWTEDATDTNKRGQYMVGIVQGVASFDPGAATDLLYAMEGTNYRYQAASVLVTSHMNESPDKAMDWAAQLPDGNQQLKSVILSQVATKVAQQDPTRCAQWALTLDAGEGQKRVISAVINYGSRESYEDTSQWVKQLPDGDNRYYAIEQMVNQWAWRNPVDTANWLNEFPASEKLDPAIDNFARRIMHKEPATAADWASSLVDQDRRSKSLANVFKNWRKKNPEAAVVWAENHAPELLPAEPQP